MTTRSVLLAGATGYIGSAVARELLARDYDVIAITRRAVEIPGCDVRVADVTDPASLSAACRGLRCDAVLSCIASRSGAPDDAWAIDCDANRNLLALAREVHAEQFLLLSAICVQRPMLAFQKAKLAFEDDLINDGIDYTIIRPTAFFKSLSGQVEHVRNGKPFVVFGDGELNACKPVSERDLASFIVDCLEKDNARNSILPIGGPGEALTPKRQAELLFAALDKPMRLRRVSPRVMDAAIGTLSLLGRMIPSLATKAELARIGRYYGTESMLVWDATSMRYDADATPETGSDTLAEHYRRVVREGLSGQELGDAKWFGDR